MLLTGAGSSLVQTSTFSLVGQIFTKNRPFVNNVVSMGRSIISIPLSVALQLWIDSYGWCGCLLLMGGVVLQALPFSLLLTHTINKMPEKLRTKFKTSKRKKVLDVKLLKNKTFLLYVTGCGFHMASMILVSIYLVRFSQSLGVDSIASASLISIVSLLDICLRPIVGWFMSKTEIFGWKVDRTLLFPLFLVIQTISTLLMATVSTDFTSLCLCTCFYSLALGFCGSLPVTVLADFFGSELLGSSIGIRFFVIGIFTLVSPPLAAVFVENDGGSGYNKYRTPFYMSAACSCAAWVILFSTRFLHRRSSNNKQVSEPNTTAR